MQDVVENPLWLSHSGRQCHGRAISATPLGVGGGVSHSGETVSQALERLTSFLKPFLADFRRREQRAHVLQAIQGLCFGLLRKNNESVAYLFGLDRKAIQHFVGEVRWDDAQLRRVLAEQIGHQLCEADGIVVFDPSAFPKKGSQSVGVARQWCGRLGKIDNCQVGVYMAYVTRLGHALVDSELFLPKAVDNRPLATESGEGSESALAASHATRVVPGLSRQVARSAQSPPS